MCTTRRGFEVVALIAGLVAAAAAGESPELQYKFEQDKHYGYDVTIKVDTVDYTETYAGFCLYQGIPAREGRIALACDGALDPSIKWKRKRGLTSYGPTDLHSMAGNLVIDPQGESHGSMMPLASLPYVLGFLETLPLEKLAAEPQNQWNWKEEFKMVESPFFGSAAFAMGPSRKATEEIDYTVTGVQGDLVRINKKYLMRTGEAVAQDVSRARMEGSGSVVFDRGAGVVASIDMNYTLHLKNKRDSRTVTAKVDCRRMNPDRLEQFLAEREDRRKRATGEAYAELPKKPFDKGEREKLLRDLRSRLPSVAEAAIVRLISAPADDRPADFSVPLAKILQEGDRGLRVKAVQALIVWATPEAEAALIEAAGGGGGSSGPRVIHGSPIHGSVFLALATVGTESAARFLAENIIEWPQTPIEGLKKMGPLAEPLMAELVLDETGGNARQRAACEVLAEIGGLKSVPALQRATEGWRAQTQAQAALEAIAKREGLSVDELIAKAGPLPSASPPAAGATAGAAPGAPHGPASGASSTPKMPASLPFGASGLRTWTDSSGKFTIEAELVRAVDGVVTLKEADGSTIQVPIDRLSQADRDLVLGDPFAGTGPSAMAQPGPSAAQPTAQPSPDGTARPPARSGDTGLVGGSGGFEFRLVGQAREPLLGLHCRVIPWQGKSAVMLTRALFDRSRAPKIPSIVMAKPDYAVGGMNVEGQDSVTALEIIFMRIKPDGSLDPADSYTTWIGTPSGQPTKPLGGTGAPVIGIYGRRGAILDAVGLVMQ